MTERNLEISNWAWKAADQSTRNLSKVGVANRTAGLALPGARGHRQVSEVCLELLSRVSSEEEEVRSCQSDTLQAGVKTAGS